MWSAILRSRADNTAESRKFNCGTDDTATLAPSEPPHDDVRQHTLSRNSDTFDPNTFPSANLVATHSEVKCGHVPSGFESDSFSSGTSVVEPESVVLPFLMGPCVASHFARNDRVSPHGRTSDAARG